MKESIKEAWTKDVPDEIGTGEIIPSDRIQNFKGRNTDAFATMDPE